MRITRQTLLLYSVEMIDFIRTMSDSINGLTDEYVRSHHNGNTVIVAPSWGRKVFSSLKLMIKKAKNYKLILLLHADLLRYSILSFLEVCLWAGSVPIQSSYVAISTWTDVDINSEIVENHTINKMQSVKHMVFNNRVVFLTHSKL